MRRMLWLILVAILLVACAEKPLTGGTTRTGVTPVKAEGDFWAALRARPLNLPVLQPGDPCPVTPTREVQEIEPVLRLPGDGPIYPHVETDKGSIGYGSAREEGGWYYVKILWHAAPEYAGPAMIRGKRLDGPEEIRFEWGSDPPAELAFPASTGVTSEYTVQGWRDLPSFTRLRAPGCYAWVVEGLTFREVIIFKAEP